MKIFKQSIFLIFIAILFSSCYTTKPVHHPKEYKNGIFTLQSPREKVVLTFWGHLAGAAVMMTDLALAPNNSRYERNFGNKSIEELLSKK